MKTHENDNQKRSTNHLSVRTGVKAGQLGFVSAAEVGINITNNHHGVGELEIGFADEVGIGVTNNH